jgi:hypothetical protein
MWAPQSTATGKIQNQTILLNNNAIETGTSKTRTGRWIQVYKIIIFGENMFNLSRRKKSTK